MSFKVTFPSKRQKKTQKQNCIFYGETVYKVTVVVAHVNKYKVIVT